MSAIALPRVLTQPIKPTVNAAAVAAVTTALWAVSGVFTMGLVGGIGTVAMGGFVSSIRTHRRNRDRDKQLTHWVDSVRCRLESGQPLDAALAQAATHCRVDTVHRLAADIKAGIATKKAVREFDQRTRSTVTDDLVAQILTTGTANNPAGGRYDDFQTKRYHAAQRGATVAGLSAVMMITIPFILRPWEQIGGHLLAELTLGGLAVLWAALVYGTWHTSLSAFRSPVSEYWNDEGQLTLSEQHRTDIRDRGGLAAPVEEFFAHASQVLNLTEKERSRFFRKTQMMNDLYQPGAALAVGVYLISYIIVAF